MEAPVIFIHKGDSDYLKYTLLSARKFNPDKRLILLGDQANAKYQKLGWEHHCFEDYAQRPEIEEFEKVYQFVAGAKHGRTEWTKFVFKRWYYIYNFIAEHDIEHFWTFDSDTLILSDLSEQESKFKAFDCTVQCGGICMNGYIANQQVVQGYVRKMNELFQREEYLEKQRKDFEINPHYAYTEMRAFDTYRKESTIKTFRLNTIQEGETFDECICIQNEMEVHSDKLYGYTVKKLYTNSSGEVFSFHLPSQQFVKLHTLNMSWVPLYLFDRVLKRVLSGGQLVPVKSKAKETEWNLISIKPTVAFKARKATLSRINRIRKVLSPYKAKILNALSVN